MTKNIKLAMHTADLSDEKFLALQDLFPEAVTETITTDESGERFVTRAIDADVLKQLINKKVVSGKEERYQFTWPDKKKAMLLANAPINKTLRPCREESVDFDNTENLYIEGDNLDVLKLLRETYLGKIKMIYIDPPYNTGRNYIYKNNFYQDSEDYKLTSSQVDEYGNRLVPNFESNGQFHTNWLNMMYPRLKIAKDFLASDGVFVCAIDENEFASLSLMLKEIFGEANYEHSYVSIVHNPRGQQGVNFSYVNEYLIIIYPSDGTKYLSDFPKEEIDSRNLRDSGSESDRVDARTCFYPFYIKDGVIIKIGEVPSDNFHPSNSNILQLDGSIEVWPMTDDGDEKKWRYSRGSVEKILPKLEAKKGRNSFQIIFNKDEGTVRSVWSNARYDSSEYGTKLLDKLFGGASFTYPKSLWAVYDCIKIATQDDKTSIVMDFFSGSGTTAHATMQLNSEDNGNRKFILVQLPENLNESLKNASDKKAKESIQNAINFLDSIQKSKNICSIAEERIRRAGIKIKEEAGLTAQNLDIGFRVLKLDESNMNNVYYSPEEYKDYKFKFEELIENVKADRTHEDILFQVMLELGVPLSAKINIDDNIISVDDNYLVACFDKVDSETVTRIAKMKPYYAVFRDSSFINDSSLINVDQIFNTYSPTTKRRVI